MCKKLAKTANSNIQNQAQPYMLYIATTQHSCADYKTLSQTLWFWAGNKFGLMLILIVVANIELQPSPPSCPEKQLLSPDVLWSNVLEWVHAWLSLLEHRANLSVVAMVLVAFLRGGPSWLKACAICSQHKIQYIRIQLAFSRLFQCRIDHGRTLPWTSSRGFHSLMERLSSSLWLNFVVLARWPTFV